MKKIPYGSLTPAISQMGIQLAHLIYIQGKLSRKGCETEAAISSRYKPGCSDERVLLAIRPACCCPYFAGVSVDKFSLVCALELPRH